MSRSQLYFPFDQHPPLLSVSDDLWMLVTDNSLKQIRIYQLVDHKPILQQVIGFMGVISSAEFSRNHEFLVIAEDGYEVLVYSKKETEFIRTQTITYA